MRLYTFSYQRQVYIGVEHDGNLVNLPFRDMLELIGGGRAALTLARRTTAQVKAKALISINKVRLLAPIPRPGKIWCSGLNYRSHIEENPNAKFLADPRFFSKLPECVIGSGEAIRHPGERFQVDWEVELGVVFGRRGFRVAPDRAMEHVFGYTIFHDVSARYVQFKDNNEQMGKNFATFAPMGPCIVTKDEIPDPTKCRLSLKVNGQVKQDFDNRDWCFPLHRMIEWVSMGLPLEPGDVMTTGTGKGVGAFAQPPRFLKPGDVCELEITGIGKLVNPVKSDPYVFRTQPNS